MPWKVVTGYKKGASEVIDDVMREVLFNRFPDEAKRLEFKVNQKIRENKPVPAIKYCLIHIQIMYERIKYKHCE
jgi:hypothetical protein